MTSMTNPALTSVTLGTDVTPENVAAWNEIRRDVALTLALAEASKALRDDYDAALARMRERYGAWRDRYQVPEFLLGVDEQVGVVRITKTADGVTRKVDAQKLLELGVPLATVNAATVESTVRGRLVIEPVNRDGTRVKKGRVKGDQGDPA